MRRIHPLVPIATVLAACISAAACTSSKTHLVPPPISAEDTIPADSTTISVQNDGPFDMDIHVLRNDGMRYRLGTALGHQTTLLIIPRYMLMGAATDLRFMADPIAGQRAAVSQTILVYPGDQVDMIIPPG